MMALSLPFLLLDASFLFYCACWMWYVCVVFLDSLSGVFFKRGGVVVLFNCVRLSLRPCASAVN